MEFMGYLGAKVKYIYLGNVPVEGNTYCPDYVELVINCTGYAVIENSLKNGSCPKCDKKIEGFYT